MTRWIRVGRVGRQHGLDGSFVVEEASEDPTRFTRGARVYLSREPATVAEAKRAGGRLVVRLDRDAERGAALELPENELPKPEPGSWYAFQLVGLEVEEEGGRRLGKVVGVTPGVANDVLELDGGHSLPVVSACLRSVDLEAGRILIARGFAEPG
jgi:16S rRNA processing protein RimM